MTFNDFLMAFGVISGALTVWLLCGLLGVYFIGVFDRNIAKDRQDPESLSAFFWMGPISLILLAVVTLCILFDEISVKVPNPKPGFEKLLSTIYTRGKGS